MLALIIGFGETVMTSRESYGGAQIPATYRGDLNAIYRSAQRLLDAPHGLIEAT